MVFGPTESGALADGPLAPRAAFAGVLRDAAGAAAGAVAGAGANAGANAGAGARAELGGGSGGAAGARSGRIPANWTSARCNFGVINFGAPCATMRVSMTIMINPTLARRAFTARTITADFESPRSNDRMGAAAGLANASAASRTALCSSGPIELSLSHSTSPASSCSETAWVRLGSTAARTFWQTASKSTSGLSDCIKGLPCSINPLLKVNTPISTVRGRSLM